jgi:creatinine amidohydrolase
LNAEQKMPDDIVLCPTLPFGSSNHHLNFGTLSVSSTTYTQFVVEVVESILNFGFRRIVLLNGHGGNITPVRQALTVLSNKYDVSHKPNIALVTYWELAGKIFAGQSPMQSPALSHACEYETSMMLHLFPEKVFQTRYNVPIDPTVTVIYHGKMMSLTKVLQWLNEQNLFQAMAVVESLN